MARRVGYIAACAALAATGCSSDDLEQSKIDYSCPRVVVLADASTVTEFTPGALEAPENKIYTARIANTSAQCETEKGLITANVVFDIRIAAGTAPAPGPMQLQYFLAATEIDQRVTGKVVRAINVVLPPGVPEVQAQTSIDGVQIPIAEGRTNRNYELVVGFQLTPQQVQYNRTPQPTQPVPTAQPAQPVPTAQPAEPVQTPQPAEPVQTPQPAPPTQP
jgi:hypothetical protein